MTSSRSAPKRVRTRLAKAELLLALACTASRWAREITGQDPKLVPFEEWGPDDFWWDLANRYDLRPEDLARLLEGLADQLEHRALSTGYDDAWIG